MDWHVFAAAATGKSHVDEGLPCQDAFAHAIAGGTLIAVVCDGAGSKSLSHLGAATVSATVTRALAGRNAEIPLSVSPLADLESIVADAITIARTELQVLATAHGSALGEFASTMVGVVADAHGGRFFHVGDGLGVARDSADGCTISAPENGEYANETFFITGDDWRSHLRIGAIAHAADRVALMSDGAMPFAMAKGNTAIYGPFIDPVERYLAAASEADGSAALLATLADPRTDRITPDDKTLLIALRR